MASPVRVVTDNPEREQRHSLDWRLSASAAICRMLLPAALDRLHSLEQLVIVLSLRSPSDASLLPCACQSCVYELADSDTLLLRNGGKDADDGLTEDASRLQILFREATPVNSIARQPL